VKGYSEWLRRCAFAPVAHPAHGNLSDFVHKNPPASANFSRKLRAKFIVILRRGERHETHTRASAERQTARQAL
jgi:hypothetical protein